MSIDARDELCIELDRWSEERRTAFFWWRDDDASDAVPALLSAIAVAEVTGAPVALAAIPEKTSERLSTAVQSISKVTILQHGVRHANYASSGSPKMELGPDRPAEVILSELGDAHQLMRRQFGDQFFPILVPPWNRIDCGLTPYLQQIGFAGISVYGDRSAEPDFIKQVNVHCDFVDWATHTSVSDVAAIRIIVDQLQKRREGSTDPRQPVGLLTHHIVHHTAFWRGFEQVLTIIRSHPAGEFIDVRTAFEAPPLTIQGARHEV